MGGPFDPSAQDTQFATANDTQPYEGRALFPRRTVWSTVPTSEWTRLGSTRLNFDPSGPPPGRPSTPPPWERPLPHQYPWEFNPPRNAPPAWTSPSRASVMIRNDT